MKTSDRWFVLIVCLVCLGYSVVTAQDAPAPAPAAPSPAAPAPAAKPIPAIPPGPPLPKGPADIMNRVNEANSKPAPALANPTAPSKPQPTAADAPPAADKPKPAQPPAAAPAVPPQPNAALAAAAAQGQAQEQEPPPVGEDPHANAASAQGAPALARRPIAQAAPSPQVAPGSIHVRVLDPAEHPIANAELQLGVMAQDGRKATPARTGADGTFVFDKLPVGDKQAYRVNVLYQGAKYSSNPFRLSSDSGYDVTIRRLDVTQDVRDIVLYVGATSLQLKDERLRIVQQARLVNIGAKTYVFPDKGLLVAFPKEAVAFQAEDVMTDQHMKESVGEGMRITGSMPPGEVTLTWGFDVPQSDTTAEFNFELPWMTFAYRVLADAAPGMKLEVDDMPPAELHTDNGSRFLVTELVKSVGEQPLRRVHIKLSGIPGPGPMRFIAVGLALCVLALGAFLSRRRPTTGPSVLAGGAGPQLTLAQEQARLLERARELEADRVRGDIGPEFHKDALRDLEEELSAVLYEQKRLSTGR